MATAAIALVALLAAACSKDDGGTVRTTGAPSGTGSGSGTAAGSGSALPICDPFGNAKQADRTVNAALSDYKVTLSDTTIPAGLVHFAIENRGPAVHEFVVVRAQSVAALPRTSAGGLDEAKLAKGAIVGEVEGFPAGQTCDGTFRLAPGRYVALCTIDQVDGGRTIQHMAQGMATPFVVTG